MDDLQELIEEIRERVVAEAQRQFANETFQQLRSSLFNGRLRDADAAASLTDADGETMEMYLKFSNDRVLKASYLADGDRASCLMGSFTAELAIGKTCAGLLKLTAPDILRRAGRFDADMEKWALVAVAVLHKAAENHWLQQKGSTTRRMPARPRFVAVGKGAHHMQYTN